LAKNVNPLFMICGCGRSDTMETKRHGRVFLK
jgi:hypothetical protein